MTLTLLALYLAVLFRVLLHFDVAITGGIARRAAAARWETRGYGARRREAQLHDVRELAVWKSRWGRGGLLDWLLILLLASRVSRGGSRRFGAIELHGGYQPFSIVGRGLLVCRC